MTWRTFKTFSQIWQATQNVPSLGVTELRILPNEIASKSGTYTSPVTYRPITYHTVLYFTIDALILM